VHTQGLGSLGLVPLLFSQDRKDEDLLELTECLGVPNPTFIHPQHETLELVLQGKPLPTSTALDRIGHRVNEILAPLSSFVVSRLRLTVNAGDKKLCDLAPAAAKTLSRYRVAALLAALPSLLSCGNLPDAAPWKALSRATEQLCNKKSAVHQRRALTAVQQEDYGYPRRRSKGLVQITLANPK
jgi:hypothetical protein